MSANLRHSFRLGIVKILGPTTSAVLLLFALYQIARAQPWPAAAGAALAALAALATWRALRSDNGRMGALLSLAWLLGCALVCYTLQHSALPWLYLVMMSNFFVTTRAIALACNATLIAVMAFTPGTLLGTEHAFSTLAVSLLISGLGYVLSTRLRDDRVHLEELASRDALTGLPNRRTLEKALSQCMSDPHRATRRRGLIVLDIDHFKEVNDLYGHAAGDQALADLATILRFEVRAPDSVYRFGGEEFVVVVRVETRDALAAISERLRKATRNALRGPGGRITVSLGAAMLCDEQNWQDWFSRADGALYRAKDAGRDSYMVAEDLPPS